MPAYVIANVEVQDADGYEEYKRLVPATIAEYGGRYLARGGAAIRLEGDWEPHRLVILEFPTLAQAQAWHASPTYTAARELRLRTAASSLLLVDGIDSGAAG